MISSKPFLRSFAGAEPTVPCSSTMLTSAWRVPELFADPAARLAAFFDEVRTEKPDIERGIRLLTARSVRITGMPRGARFREHRVPARFHHRRERDDVDLLRDEAAQRLDLVFLLLLRVREAQVDVAGARRGLDRFGVRGAPFAFGADLAESEHDALVAFSRAQPAAASTAAASRAAPRSPNEALIVPPASTSERRGVMQRETAWFDRQLVDQRRTQRRQVDFEVVARPASRCRRRS